MFSPARGTSLPAGLLHQPGQLYHQLFFLQAQAVFFTTCSLLISSSIFLHRLFLQARDVFSSAGSTDQVDSLPTGFLTSLSELFLPAGFLTSLGRLLSSWIFTRPNSFFDLPAGIFWITDHLEHVSLPATFLTSSSMLLTSCIRVAVPAGTVFVPARTNLLPGVCLTTADGFLTMWLFISSAQAVTSPAIVLHARADCSPTGLLQAWARFGYQLDLFSARAFFRCSPASWVSYQLERLAYQLHFLQADRFFSSWICSPA